MKRIRLFLPLLLLLFLLGCSSKILPLSSSLAIGIGPEEPNDLSFVAGTTVTIPLTLPETNPPTTLALSATPPLKASFDGRELTLTCDEPGDCSLNLTLQAEGYEPVSFSCRVRIDPPPLSLSVSEGDTGTISSLSLSRGETAVLTLHSEEGAVLSAESTGGCVASVDGNQLTVTAEEAGDGSVLLHASLPGWQDAELTLPVTVAAVPAELSVPAASLSALVGETVRLSCTIDPQGTLSVACDPRLSADVSGGTVSFQAAEPGNYQVDLTVEAPGDLPATQTIWISVSLPSVSLSVPASIELSAGGSITVPVSVTSGASVWVQASDGLSASIGTDGSLTVSASRQGSGTVTVGAELAGYQSATASIPVTVNISLPPASSRYQQEAREIAALVNEERAAHGLKALEYRASLDGLSQLRAREASEVWSHTRPDGRDFYTVFTDYGLVYRGTGENLFAANLLDTELAMEEWMNSPSHRANILLPDNAVDGISVGIVRGDDGDYYICQLFVAD